MSLNAYMGENQSSFIYLFSIKGLEQFCSVVLAFTETELSGKGNLVSCQLLQSAISFSFGQYLAFLSSLAGGIISVRPYRPSPAIANIFPSRNR